MIIDGDARFRGLANDDNGTCLIGGSIHGNPPYGADPVGRPTTSVVNRCENGRGMPLPYKNAK